MFGDQGDVEVASRLTPTLGDGSAGDLLRLVDIATRRKQLAE